MRTRTPLIACAIALCAIATLVTGQTSSTRGGRASAASAANGQSSSDWPMYGRDLAGSHSNPTFGGDTLYCRHEVIARDRIPGRQDVGALRLRMIATKNVSMASLPALETEGNAAIVLELDYSVLIGRRNA